MSRHPMFVGFAGLVGASALAAVVACGSGHGNNASGGADDGSITPGNDGGSVGDGAAGDGGVGPGQDGAASCDASAPPGDILTACGTIDPIAYRAMAPKLGTATGITYRYGAPCSVDGGGIPTWSHPSDNQFSNVINGNNAPGWTWQVGGPESSATDQNLNDYASNIGEGLYVADTATDPGVLDLDSYTMASNTFAESPQLPWVYYGGGDPDVNVADYQKAGMTGLLQPIAESRCYGYFGWCENSLVGFPNGLLVTTGTNTARNEATLSLPAGKVPTAVAVTNANEFALVTVWDTINLKGQVAVIALAGTCDGCPKQASYNWWGEWAALYPGLRNLGDVGFMKLLGFIDLPGMMAPTEISASGNYIPSLDDQQGWMCSADGSNCRTTAWDLPLSTETNRQSFIGSGPNANRYTKSGFAVVISKSEREAIFLDLKPLFAEVQSMYFGTLADFTTTQSLGQADNQWPYAFAYLPSFAPGVVKTVSLPQPPTSVKTSLENVNRAWVATEDGTLHIFGVGGYGNDTAATPSDISEVGTVAVGKNPTWIAYAKHESGWTQTAPAIDKEVIVLSRAECRVDWVQFGSNDSSGSIVRTLRDSRIVDPIAVEDNDNHGTESYLLTVADYGGKQIMNYRYGPVIFWTNPGAAGNSVAAACQPPNGCGMGSSGTDPFEFGGTYGVPGNPFRFTSANTP